MGYVDAGGTKRFVLRVEWLFGRGVEFVAGGIRSGYLNLTPGDIVDWEINEGPSRATIRRR